MATYAEVIAALRERRETVSTSIARMQSEQKSLSLAIRSLEAKVTRPKAGEARPDDQVPEGETIVMAVEPASVGAKTGREG